MLFCPLMFYGSAREHDMDFGQFSIMFRSIFLEGLGPALGRRAADPEEPGAQVQATGRRAAAAGRRQADRGRATAASTRVVLDDGTRAGGRARAVVGRLGRDDAAVRRRQPRSSRAGRASSRSSKRSRCSTRSRATSATTARSCSSTTASKFHWHKPDELVDVRSGVICSPNNFAYDQPLADGMMRITALANFDRWQRPAGRGLSAGQAALVRSDGRTRPCASCPTSAPT